MPGSGFGSLQNVCRSVGRNGMPFIFPKRGSISKGAVANHLPAPSNARQEGRYIAEWSWWYKREILPLASAPSDAEWGLLPVIYVVTQIPYITMNLEGTTVGSK